MREKFPSVRIAFLTESEPSTQMMLIGKQEEVEAVKKIYLGRHPLLLEDILFDMVRFFNFKTLIRLAPESRILNKAIKHALRLLRRLIGPLTVLHLIEIKCLFNLRKKIK
jgi:hypothetical protein